MGQIVFIAALTVTSVVSLARPWIGVVAAYLIAILTPQAVWWWNFEGLRPAYWVLLPTLLGFGFGVLRKQYDLSTLANRRNLYMLLLWGFYTLSYVAGPYVDAEGQYRFTDPDWAFSTLNKMFLLYFVACVCIDTERKLTVLMSVIVGSGMYLVFWANDMYLSGNAIGRMSGPINANGGGVYADQNNFALLFVTALPFIWHIGFTLKNQYMRYAMWLFIPFGWHAVFLTGSRGGLLGIAATMAITVWRSKNG